MNLTHLGGNGFFGREIVVSSLLGGLGMVTPLERPIRRLIQIDDKAFVVTLTPTGVRLVLKGRRKGVEVTWRQILDGEVELHAQLAESLAQHAPSSTPASSSGRPRGDRR